MNTTFVAIDVETANADRSSICQVGAVRIENGVVTDTFATLVDPETYFDPWNIQIHGITATMVRGQLNRHQYLIVACRQFAEYVCKMARLRRMLIQLGLFAAENQRWRIRRLGTGKLLKQGKEVGSLEAMPHSRQTAKEVTIPGLDAGNRLLKYDRLR